MPRDDSRRVMTRHDSSGFTTARADAPSPVPRARSFAPRVPCVPRVSSSRASVVSRAGAERTARATVTRMARGAVRRGATATRASVPRTRARASAGRGGASRARARAASSSSASSARSEEATTSEGVRYHTWRGHRVGYRSSGREGTPIVLIHGFGVSSFQFRDNVRALGAKHRVYALDLVGFGTSDQPDVPYNMEFWRDQVIDFVENVVGEPAVLVGNSIGSLAAVHVASASPKSTKGIALINCAGGMNNKVKRLDGDFDGYGWQYKAIVPIFNVVLAVIDTVLKIEPIAKPLFNNVRGEENVRGALGNVYMDSSRVDDALVKSICGAANREGAFKAFVNILTGPAGPRPEELMPKVTCPILILWGSKDTITPLDFPLGQYFFNLPKTRAGRTDFIQFDGEGHCVQDDNPKLVNDAIDNWIATLGA